MQSKKRRLFALFLTLSMLLSVIQPVFAANDPAPDGDQYAYILLDRTAMSGFTATTKKDPPQWNDGPAEYAFDGRLDTGWHSDYNDKELPQSIEWQLGGSYRVGKVECMKKTGGSNGIWKDVKVEGLADGQWVLLGSAQGLPNANSSVTFAPRAISALRVTILDSHNNSDGCKYASAGEINVYRAIPAGSPARQALRALCAQAEALSPEGYTADSFAALAEALTEAQAVLNDEASGDAACNAAAQALEQAMAQLTIDPDALADGAPASGTTKGSPFPSGTAGSTNFRIPSIITLKNQKDEKLNGRLVAAIDARWNHTGDACALDTILSVSDDNGENWAYSFPNFFNDSSNAKASNGTAFIDPVMTEGEDGTIYLMVDLFPGGVAINTAPRRPARESGYQSIGGKDRLVLYTMTGETQTAENYTYYVGDFARMDGKTLAPVLPVGGGQAPAFYVDQHYYLYDGDKAPMYCRQLEGSGSGSRFVQQNVFFYNADLHVRDASYLWLVSSQDGGRTWSAPSILNPMIRKTSGTDMFYGVGPGAGLSFVDGKGSNVILLQGYTFTLGMPSYNQVTSFVYSADNGVTWHRGPDATQGGHWSSESALVQIDGNTVRQFYRDGYNTLNYTDFTWNAETGTFTTNGTSVSVPGASKTANNQLSALKYSQTEDGKPVYMVSTANGGGGSRTNGRIFVLTLEADKTMKVLHTYEVNNAKYGYSSLTETAEGSVALLYEGQTQDGRYGEDIYFRLISKDELIPAMPQKQVALKVGETKTFPMEGELVSNEPAGVVEASVATLTENKAQGLIGTDTSFSAGTQALDTALFTFTKQGEGASYQITADYKGQKVYMQLNTAGGTGGYPMAGTGEGAMTLEEVPGVAYRFFLRNSSGGSRYLYFWKDGKCLFDAIGSMTDKFKEGSSFLLYRPADQGEESSRELPGYVKAADLSEIRDGGQYLIANDYNGELYVMRPSTANKTDKFSYVLKVSTQSISQTLALKGLTPGTAQVVAGGTLYNVTVTEPGPQKLTGRNVNFYAYVDGQLTLVKNRPDVTTFWIDGRQCLDAATLVSAYGELGFRAQDLTAGSGLFLHTDRGMKNIWNAGTKEMDGVVYAASINHKVDNQGYKGSEIDLFYLPRASVSNNIPKTDAAMIARETFYTLTEGDNTAYFLNGEEVEVVRPNVEGKQWTLTGKDGEVLEAQVGEEETTFTIAAMDQPYTLALADNKPVVYTVTVDGAVHEQVPAGTLLGQFLPASPARNGHTFAGWYAGEVKVTADTAVEQDMTVQSRWSFDVFTDVKESDWFYEGVRSATFNGLFAGISGNQFGPTLPMDRSMVVQVLYGMAGKPKVDSDKTFSDVAEGQWYSDAVAWAVENGAASGYPDGRFGTFDSITREQLAVMLYGFAGKPAVSGEPDFADADRISLWARTAVQWAAENGIMSGVGGGNISPHTYATRAEGALMMTQFSKLMAE